MSSSKPKQAPQKTDQETLRELSNLEPDECLKRIADELRIRINCETACILLWHEVGHVRGEDLNQILVTEYDAGMPEPLVSGGYHSEVYRYGEGITGGYIFERQKCIRAKIDLAQETVYDEEGKCLVDIKDAKWHHMRRFGDESRFREFKSLLGLPLIVKNQSIGVVKLINRISETSDDLATAGFTSVDLDRVKNFLNTIEHVIETKTNEKQIANLLKISEKVISADFDYQQLLQEIAVSCAETLNLRVCILRLSDQLGLSIKGNSVGMQMNSPFGSFGISKQVIQTRSAVKLVGKHFQAVPNSDLTDAVIANKAFQRVRLPKDFGAHHEIKSFLAVPIVYQDRAVGVIECYASLSRDFSRQQIGAVRAYGTLIATLFQRNRIKDALAGLVEPYGLLSDNVQIYRRIIDQIDKYLNTKTISVWEKKAQADGFIFRLESAEPTFYKKYQRKKISVLTESSLTARVADGNSIAHFTQEELDRETIEHRKFLGDNDLHSLTMVPITIGGQTHAVIHVFYGDNRTLLKEDENFLRLLTGKAAAAIWNKKLTLSFKDISDALLSGPDVGFIIKRIADVAREVLFADVVIVFQYDVEHRSFMPPKWSGPLLDPHDIYAGGKAKRRDFVNLMLREPKPLYLEGTKAYKKFCQDKGTVRPWLESDFWFREQVSSLAAVRLDNGRGKPVGVMFFNYRSPFKFEDSTKQVIESFASQAASALVNVSFKGMRNEELLTEHEAAALLTKLSDVIDLVGISLTDVNESGSLKRAGIADLSHQLEATRELQTTLNAFRGRFKLEADFHSIDDLIENVLAVLAYNLNARGIKPNCFYQSNIPSIFCDPAKVQGVLYVLMSLILEASTAKSSLTIRTELPEAAAGSSNVVTVLLELAGDRVNDEDLESIRRMASAKLDSCIALARSHQGDIGIEATPDGLQCYLNLGLD